MALHGISLDLNCMLHLNPAMGAAGHVVGTWSLSGSHWHQPAFSIYVVTGFSNWSVCGKLYTLRDRGSRARKSEGENSRSALGNGILHTCYIMSRVSEEIWTRSIQRLLKAQCPKAITWACTDLIFWWLDRKCNHGISDQQKEHILLSSSQTEDSIISHGRPSIPVDMVLANTCREAPPRWYTLPCYDVKNAVTERFRSRSNFRKEELVFCSFSWCHDQLVREQMGWWSVNHTLKACLYQIDINCVVTFNDVVNSECSSSRYCSDCVWS